MSETIPPTVPEPLPDTRPEPLPQTQPEPLPQTEPEPVGPTEPEPVPGTEPQPETPGPVAGETLVTAERWEASEQRIASELATPQPVELLDSHEELIRSLPELFAPETARPQQPAPPEASEEPDLNTPRPEVLEHSGDEEDKSED